MLRLRLGQLLNNLGFSFNPTSGHTEFIGHGFATKSFENLLKWEPLFVPSYFASSANLIEANFGGRLLLTKFRN